VTALRRELGHQLAGRRKAAGYAQRELGVLVGYSRTAIANAETGGTALGRQLWQEADRVLGTGELFARGYDRIRAQKAAESRPYSEQLTAEQQKYRDDLGPVTLSQSQRACQDRGWPAEHDPAGRLWLSTGTAIDALEVPHPAGMVAMHWWLYTRGLLDPIRGLLALPDVREALPTGLVVVLARVAIVQIVRARETELWVGVCARRENTHHYDEASQHAHGVVRPGRS